MGKQSAVRKLAGNEATAKATFLRTSPYKLSLIANFLRGMKAEEALVQLQFSPKRIAGEIRKVLLSAVANAENNHNLDVDRLEVADVRVGKALVMKRFHARARGRAARVQKYFSRLEIIVRERDEE